MIGFNLDLWASGLLGHMPTVPGAIGAFRRAAPQSVGLLGVDTPAEGYGKAPGHVEAPAGGDRARDVRAERHLTLPQWVEDLGSRYGMKYSVLIFLEQNKPFRFRRQR
ncbi:hypothetical protein [Nonomuraea turkmeniaca]|uniref:hypothetical protein n=1 Tax=Nonomuraea turkmeniaca TaxID=103838 RepID=UPI001B85D679|nr:hypothetical protein [Nonomuraea turkmeniaca]